LNLQKLKEESFYFRQSIIRILTVAIIFMVIRFAFFFGNINHFRIQSVKEFFSIIFHGFRYDIAAITYVNAILLILYLIPVPFRSKKWFQIVLGTIFVITNIVAILFEIVDIPFFKFANRRSILSDVTLMANTANMIVPFIKEFWYIPFGLILFIYGMGVFFKKTILKSPPPKFNFGWQSLQFLIGIIVFSICARGSIGHRPLMPIDSSKFVENAANEPLVTNTSINFIFSFQQIQIREQTYFSEEAANEIYSIYNYPKPSKPFEKKNVVVIALESFGKEYISSFNNKKNYGPFLDSLIKECYYTEYSYANALRSVQGIGAINTTIPSIMNDPFIFSAYSTNPVESMAGLLKKKGYQTGFFHGCVPGSMKFNEFAYHTGYQKFYDRYGYPDQKDFDGNWGIWDDKMEQFMVRELDTYQQPFYAFHFTLTSHHPFNVEDWFAKKYPKMDPFERAYRYTDASLQHFFESASTRPWFKNTLFVICADHIGISSDERFQNRYGKYNIPILFYTPDGSLAPSVKKGEISSHIDILPSIMDYLHFDLPYMSFGKSIFNNDKRYSFQYENGDWQVMDEKYILFFDGKHALNMFDYNTDEYMKKDILKSKKEDAERLTNVIKSVIQQHNHGMIANKLKAVGQ
jgi:phosphoglycerol transferase MdoB-like AlkP superfamily enzyme